MLTQTAPKPQAREGSNCSIARSLEIVGDKWTLLILRESWYGVTRFSDFEKSLGCPRNLLSARLKMLVGEQVFSSREYHEPGARVRSEYVLTQKGRELLPVAVGLMNWGDKFLADEKGPAIILKHRGCEAHINAEIICKHGHPVDAADIAIEPGPGFK